MNSLTRSVIFASVLAICCASLAQAAVSPHSASGEVLAGVGALAGGAPLDAAPPAKPVPVGLVSGEPIPAETSFGEALSDNAAPDNAVSDEAFDFELEAVPDGFPDPLESSNRAMLGFNRGLERWFFDPLNRAYRFALPVPVRDSVRRAFLNLGSVPVLANDLLQLDLLCAGHTLARIFVNSTVGIGGLFDPAADAGWERHESDFGQSLARAGVGSGPYLVLPVLGPSTIRGGIGAVADSLLHPATYVFPLMERLTFGSSYGLSARDDYYEALRALEESSVEYYAALRNGYYQSRVHLIAEERECSFRPRSVR